ncbi:MAG: GNAT family N-acetyltransferase [Halieaceae bacterium]|jgi:GNAT superfamily N-acetyltransferase|nr:GNAT family N-acetyltransferase [Halieaceae bacterium]
MDEISIRALEPGDKADWRRLWTLYLEYYESSVPEAVYQSTWQRLLSGLPNEYQGLMAFSGERAVGLTHYLFHRHCWRIENVCYLQDLVVDTEVRGRSIGRALIEAVYAAADAEGCPKVYWTTQHFNEAGRRLYDRVGELTPFIKYERPD